MSFTRMFLSLVTFAVATFHVQAQAAGAAKPIPRLVELSPGIYRGGRPETAGIQQLASMGVKTIINLENSDSAVEQEIEDAKAAGLDLRLYGMSASQTPNDSEIDEIMSLLADESLRPIFLHCKHGRDRTGIVTALHRVINEGWDPQRAYTEAKERGFRTYFTKLVRYFEQKTNSQVSAAPRLELAPLIVDFR